MKKFDIGDLVEHNTYGLGKVIGYSDSGNPGVEFLYKMGGHSCDGLGEDEHCWWCDPSIIKKIPIFKENEKVIIKKNLNKIKDFAGGYLSSMKEYEGKSAIIKDINYDSGSCYLIVIIGENPTATYDSGLCWDIRAIKKDKNNIEEISEEESNEEETKPVNKEDKLNIEVFEKVFDSFNKQLEERNKDFNKVLETNLKEFTKEIKQRTIYDELVQDEVLNKAKKLALKDIEEELHKDTNEYIKKTFGLLPKKIEITNEGKVKELEGIFHKKFEEILKIVNKNVPLMLTGPAGAGKNYTLEQVAKALDLPFYFTNAITQEYKLTGFIDAGGKYQETQFYKAFKDGGLFFLDEVDASVPEALIILNSAIANGYFDFPNGRINAHKDFRVVCAGNTYGTGADMVYVGRNALDGATLDRFAVIEFDYDEEVEKQLAYDDDLYRFIKELRDTIKEASLRYIVSMRATINATKLLEIGIPKADILKSVIIKNMQPDDLSVIVKKISGNNEWTDEFKKVAKC